MSIIRSAKIAGFALFFSAALSSEVLGSNPLKGFLVPTRDVVLQDLPAERLLGPLTGDLTAEKKEVVADLLQQSKAAYEISGAFDAISDWRWRAVYFDAGGDKLLIVNQGHGGSPFDPPFADLMELAIDKGFDIVALPMAMWSWNQISNVDVKTWDGPSHINGIILDHGFLEMLDTGKYHYMGFLVTPTLASLDKILERKSYKLISAVGLSGGGMVSAFAAAADERIDNTVSVAGGLPLFARISPRDLGDAEQYDRRLYRRFPWLKVWEMATSGRRKLTLFFNDKDDCCFSAKSVARLPHSPNYKIRVVKSTEHSFDPEDVLDVLDTLF